MTTKNHHNYLAIPEDSYKLDYSLVGENSKRAIRLGLAEADWYQSPLPRELYRELLIRKNGPAIRDSILLLIILVSTAIATIVLWGTWWVVAPYLIYSVFYATSSDSRWHECSHGTAFKSDWLNSLVYEIASFMVMRESVVWRWSHVRHHSDTIIVGRDPEIQVTRPPDIKALVLSIFNVGVYEAYYSSLITHALGRMSDSEKTFIPESEFPKIFRNARIILSIYLLIILSAIFLKSWIPIFLFLLPNIFGTWLMIVHNTTQHAGLAENVLDHRLNCRTVYMNPISRFIYWNMNYHLEHHMFPLVPYHALPKLHELVKDDCPPVYTSIYAAWKEIIPAILKQVKDPSYHIKRKLPQQKQIKDKQLPHSYSNPDEQGWVSVCSASILTIENVIRFDHLKRTYAIYRDKEGKLFATDGICTHGNTHLSEGLVKDDIIECPKHNGRFNLKDGSPARAPICRGLITYPVKEHNGQLFLNVNATKDKRSVAQKKYTFKVVSNKNVSTFIKELVLVSTDNEKIPFTPGDYLQIDIPSYDGISFDNFVVPEPYYSVWKRNKLFELNSSNPQEGRRNNYSVANNPLIENELKFNVRIATPPTGQDCPPGVGSSYIFNLKKDDKVTAIGPFGDFHIKPTLKEMVYIGGGAGMAPIRSHIAHLFENMSTNRKVSYWYGARATQEIFYENYFRYLSKEHDNFRFELALSNASPEENWTGHKGFIHEVVKENYLIEHPNIDAVEFYLCGPPMMVSACVTMLKSLGANDEQISYDEF